VKLVRRSPTQPHDTSPLEERGDGVRERRGVAPTQPQRREPGRDTATAEDAWGR